MRALADAWRPMRRQPGPSALAVVTLALGLGASAAVFSVADAALWRSLAVEDPGGLVLFEWTFHANRRIAYLTGDWTHDAARQEVRAASFSVPAFERFRDEGTTLARVFACTHLGERAITIDGNAERLRAEAVSGGYFAGLGLRPALGRLIGEGDEDAAVLSHAYWMRGFGGAKEIVGRSGTIDGHPFTIAGVAPRGFAGTLALGPTPDLILPLAFQSRLRPGRPDPNAHALQVMARLQPGVSRAKAEAEMSVLLERSLPEAAEYRPRFRLVSGRQGGMAGRRGHRQPLALLGGATALVFLMAGASVTGLQLARASTRAPEIGVRLALGASRGQLVRQSLAESALLAVLGGALGLVLAAWTKHLLAAGLFRDDVPAIPLDLRVLGFMLAAAAAMALLVGLAPVLRAGALSAPLTLWRRPAAPSRTLVAAQMALSFVLLVGAGLLLRTLANLGEVEAGFDRESVVVFRLQSNEADLGERLRARLRGWPGVAAVGRADHDLVEGDRDRRAVSIEGGPAAVDGRDYAFVNHVDGDFFAATGIAIRSGRAITEADAGRAVMVVNEAFAARYFPGGHAVGRRVNGQEIVGVAQDTKYGQLREPSPATMYVSPKAVPRPLFFVRTDQPPSAVAATVRALLRELSPSALAYGFDTPGVQVARSIAPERFLARVTATFGVIALLLAGLGLYGVTAYAVQRGTRDIGVRMALGARPSDISRWTLGEGLRLTVAGMAAGLAGAVVLARVVASVLYGVSPHDPLTFVAAAAVLATVALLACWRPARLAARIDPAAALRYE